MSETLIFAEGHVTIAISHDRHHMIIVDNSPAGGPAKLNVRMNDVSRILLAQALIEDVDAEALVIEATSLDAVTRVRNLASDILAHQYEKFENRYGERN